MLFTWGMSSMCTVIVRSVACVLRRVPPLATNAQSRQFRHRSLCACRTLLSPPHRAGQHKEPVFPEISFVITSAMSKGWSFDSLTTSFGSVELTQPLVESVLLDLKEPDDAKKALTFFHWSSRTRRFEHDLRSYCFIVHILVRAGLLVDARALLESAIGKYARGSSVAEVLLSTYEAVLPGRRVFDLLLQTYSNMRLVGAAFDACRYLGDRGFDASLISFNTMLRVAQRSGQSGLAWKVFEYMLVRRIYPNKVTTQVMVDVMCKAGVLPKMVGVLDRIHGKRCPPGVIVNAALAFRIIEEGRAEEAIVLLKRMLQRNMVLDDIAYSLIISAYCKMPNLDSAYETRNEMINRSCSLNSFVYTSLIGSYSERSIEEAVRLMEEMLSMGLRPYDETYNHLIVGLLRTGRTEESLKHCEKMLDDGFMPSCSACNEILSALCEAGEVEEANRMLTSLLEKGLVPDRDMYLSLINGYGDTGNAREVLKLYYEMEHRGIGSDPVVYTSMIRNLCRCGKVDEAEKFLSIGGTTKESVPTSCMYDSLITGYCIEGDVPRALLLYDDMIMKELVPCTDTFMRLVKEVLRTRASRHL